MLVGGGAEAAEDFGFGVEGFGERLAFAAVDGLKDSGNGEWSHGGDGLGQCAGAGEEFGGRYKFVDQADAEGFCGVDKLRGEHDAEGGAAADEAGEALGSAVAGDEAELDLRKAETGLVAGDAEGAGEGEFAATTEGYAVDGGDDRLAGTLEVGLDESEDLVATLGVGTARDGVGFGQGADVGPGGEGAIACAGEQDDANGGVSGEGGEEVLEFVEHLGVEGVEDLGAIEGDGGDGAVEGAVQGGECGGIDHGGLRPLRVATSAERLHEGHGLWKEAGWIIGTAANANR